ncbi:MAG: hypothetical protein IPJ78_00770 [Gemmatimonadetes bacterium]|jgi:hypothetical protein|nr:hypothetical protein [Gemmatimonadota bacterium]MBP7551179.1 hypothetical protein [Gemmatimonadaceae bacterium]
MEREKRPAFAALVLFATAWFLPVEAASATLADGVLPGWQAFLVAIGPATWHKFAEIDLLTIREVLMAMSALSNLLMAYTLALVLAWPRIHFPVPYRLSAQLWAAFVLNVQWIWPRGGEFLDLRAGYWLWCGSFALAAVAVRRLERRRGRDDVLVAHDRRQVRRAAMLAGLFLLVAPPARAQTTSADSAAVVGVVERYIAAMSARDTAYLRAASLPTMATVGVTVATGAVAVRTLGEFLVGMASDPRVFSGVLRSPAVTVDGPIAHLVAPYVTRFDGIVSHCGIDHYVLVRSGGRWLASQMVFTRRTDSCGATP